MRNACSHCKVIGHTAGGAKLLVRSGLMGTGAPGVMALGDARTFVAAAKQDRVWSREAKVLRVLAQRTPKPLASFDARSRPMPGPISKALDLCALASAATHYTLAARALHWLTVLLILATLPVAWVMVSLPEGLQQASLFVVHRPLG